MSNVVVPTSPTLDGSCGARPGRRGHGAGLGTPSLRRRPGGRARLVDSVPTHHRSPGRHLPAERTGDQYEHLGLNENARGEGHDDDFGGERPRRPQARRATTADLSWMLWTALGSAGSGSPCCC